MKNIIFNLFLTLAFCQNNFGQYTDVINSNRPGESMSAYGVGKKIIQVESGINYVSTKHDLLDYETKGINLDLVARYGFFTEELEFIGALNLQSDKYTDNFNPFNNIEEQRTGIKAISVGLKYLVFDPFKNYEEKIDLHSWKANHKFKWRQFIPAVSVFAGTSFNLKSNKFISENEKISMFSPKVMLITQNIFTKGYVFVTNIFYDKITNDHKTLGYVATLTKGFNDKWTGFIENKAVSSDFYADAIVTVGAAYLISKNIQLDASISKNFKNTPDIIYGGIGFSWRNDKNYKPVKYSRAKEGKKDKKDKKDTKKEEKTKSKKRIDEVDLEKTK